MMRRYGMFSPLLLLAFLSGIPQGLSVGQVIGRCANAAPARPKGVGDSIAIRNDSRAALRNYPFQFGRPFLDGAIADQPQVLIDGTPVATQADVKNRYRDGSVEFAVVAVVIPSLPAGRSLRLTFRNQTAGLNTPLTKAQMLDRSFNFNATMRLTGTGPGSTPQTVSARTMLKNGDYKLWTSGPVAQTIILADDSTAHKYDIGFGDGYHPFRPRFYATFWPATHQVFVRAVGENDNTRELEDLAYKLSISGGDTAPVVEYNADLTGKQTAHPKLDWAMTRWTRTFWLGGAPNPQVNIDNNLAYLESTRFIPNFDPSQTIPAATIASEYAAWTGTPHDLYDGAWDGGVWENAMAAPGGRPEIGPYPTWTVLWLYSGDWRMRAMALGLADLAGAFPANLRESDPTKRLSRADPTGLNPETGLGHTVSITDRKTLDLYNTSLLTYSYTLPADAVKIVGPMDLQQPWTFDGAHQPAPFYPQYILTGDPWYLSEMYAWAGFSAARYNGANSPHIGSPGPSGDYGGITDELRGAGWVVRNRAETAFAAPDAAPEKAYFTYLTNDALAGWEGGLQITGTAYDGTTIKTWGSSTGDFYSDNLGPDSAKPPTLHNWESNCPLFANAGPCPTVTLNETTGIYVPGAVGSFTAGWMQYYVLYGLGRARELGFAAGPLLTYTNQWMDSMIASPDPDLVALYQTPVEQKGGGFFTTWGQVIAALIPAYLNGTQSGGGLPAHFTRNLGNVGREVWGQPGLAMAIDDGAPGAAAAWNWWLTNVYDPVDSPTPPGSYGGPWNQNPQWDIVPRTDTNALPPIPTATPPG